MKRAALAALAALMAAASGACADLDELAENACGNAVVEAQAGEDCDTFVDDALGPGLECGAPASAAQACRYLCDGARCPVGWSCGEDGICRAHSGVFESDDGPVLAVSADQLLVGNFYDDEQAEIVARRGGDFTVFANEDDELARDSELTLRNARSDAFARDVDGDGFIDLLMPGTLRPLDPGAPRVLHVLRRGRERLQTAVLPGTAVGGLGLADVTAVRRVSGAPAAPGAAGQVPVVVAERGAELLAFVPEPACPTLPDAVAASLGASAGRVPLEPLALAVGPDDVWAVFPVDDESELQVASVVRRCDDNACPSATADAACITELVTRPPLDLGMRVRAPGCGTWDVDGDGAADLVCHGPNQRIRAFLAEEEGLGAPVELTEALAGRTELPATQSRTCDEGHALLATADLDGDGQVDLVTPHGVFLATADGLERAFARERGDAWGSAVVGDYDGDGALEVVASVRSADADCQATQLERLTPTAGTFNASLVPEAPPPDALAGGDFDGDGLADLAAAGRLTGGARRIVVFFGDRKEALEDLAVVGQTDGLDALAVLRSRVGTEVNDELLSDLVVVSREGTAWALATGTTDRTMLAPLSLPLGVGAELDDPGMVALAGPLLPRSASESESEEDDDEVPADLLVLAPEHAWLLREEARDEADAVQRLHAAELPAALRRLELSCSRFSSAPRGVDGALIVGVGPVAGGDGTSCEGAHELTVAAFAADDAASLSAFNRALPDDVSTLRSLHTLDFGAPGDGPDAIVLVARTAGASGTGVLLFEDLQAEPGVSAADPRALLQDETVFAVAPVNADLDRDLEIAALTSSGLVVVDRRVEDDAETIAVLPDAAAPAPPGLDAAGVVQLVVGRLDEDDLDDLALLVGESVYLLPGVPAG